MESTTHYASEEPKYMHYQEIQTITENLKNELGRGGFGVVYKGKCEDKEVAVKVLFESPQGNQDNEFKEELTNLMKLSHQNIIQLVGYCCETYQKYDQRIDKWDIVPRTALCIEYAPNGNLRKYTFDENNRLDWPKVYNIIKGTCEGLYYLHHHTLGSMWHLDLKPENILLDHNMDPKIADFGLSKLFTNPTTKLIQMGGTTDYVPLEYKMRGKVTRKYDIFSLGVVIIEMMAGIGTYRIINDFDNHEDFIKLVLEKWNDILSGYHDQVKACIEIAIKCVDIKPENRLELTCIIDKLKAVENIVPPTPLSQTSSKYEGSSTGETGLTSLETTTIATCDSLPSRSLAIEWGDDARFWRWISVLKSRYDECAELLGVCYLNVSSREIAPKDMSAGKRYTVYLVYKLANSNSGLDGVVLTSGIKHHGTVLPNTTSKVILYPKAHGAAGANDVTYPVERADGWLELRLGELPSENKTVTVELHHEDANKTMSGIIIEGMEIRSQNLCTN